MLIFILACSHSDRLAFHLSPQEALELSQQADHWLSLDEFNAAPDHYQLVDLRSKTAFSTGHLEQAINIPVTQLMEKKQFSALKAYDKPLVLYADSYQKTVAPWMLLRQLGYDQVKILHYSYPYEETKELTPDPIETGLDFVYLQAQAVQQYQRPSSCPSACSSTP